jgi:hypothetical protein
LDYQNIEKEIPFDFMEIMKKLFMGFALTGLYSTFPKGGFNMLTRPYIDDKSYFELIQIVLYS